MVWPRTESLHCCSHASGIRHCLQPRLEVAFSLNRLSEEAAQRWIGSKRSESETSDREHQREEQRAHQFFSGYSDLKRAAKKETLKLIQRLLVSYRFGLWRDGAGLRFSHLPPSV